MDGPTLIRKNLTMPEADTPNGYPWIPVTQIVNHLLAQGVDARVYRAGVEED